jgi:hypothetical protein
VALLRKGPLDGDGELDCLAVAPLLRARLVMTLHFFTSAASEATRRQVTRQWEGWHDGRLTEVRHQR